MIAFIQFFCVSLLVLSIEAGELVELQFLPNEIAEITTSVQSTKEIKIQDTITRFQSKQSVKMDLYLNEEDHQFDSIAKFPFHFTLALKEAKLNGEKNGMAISQLDLDTIEKAEIKSLLNRHLRFILKERGLSLELEEDQKKIFGDYQALASRNFQGIFEEDVKDIFLFADLSLKVGETFTFSKNIGLLKMPVAYTVQEITPESIVVSFSGKLDRTKLPVQLLQTVIQAVVFGEIQGEILWNRKNSLYFTSNQTGHFDYKFKLEGKESAIQVELHKSVVSRPKAHAN